MNNLNNRITQLCYRHTIITDAQFGFRKGKYTVDAIFVLMSVIQKYIFEQKRLYVVLVVFVVFVVFCSFCSFCRSDDMLCYY